MNHADRNITRSDVAKLANVSVGTVSNVINNKTFVKAELVEKVRKVIEELDYVPDFNAKSLAKRKTNHIGVAVFEMTNPYHAEVIQGIEEYAADHGYIVSIFLLDKKRQRKLDAICERRLDGLINFMTNDLPREFIGILRRQKIVLVNFTMEDGITVIVDYSQPMKDCMYKLKELGHKNVAYLCIQDKTRFDLDSRGETFFRERENCGFDLDENLVLYNSNFELHSEEIGYLQVDKLLEKRSDVTAIFTTNDLAAMGIIKRLAELNYSVPNDISVIGCDDIMFGKYFNPGITTITCDKRQYGASIAEAMIESIENPEVKSAYKIITIKTQALFRNSIASVKK